MQRDSCHYTLRSRERKGTPSSLVWGLALILLFFAFPVAAQPQPFDSWLQQLQQDAIASGVTPITAQQALAQIQLEDRVIALDQKQPEQTITFATYSRNILNPQRIKTGRQLLARHRVLLGEVGKRYGVDPAVIVALWGIESNFGRNTGGFSTLNALATLAYEGRRAAFFRKELIAALQILDEERREPASLRGSWAGAMGQCQFMPSTYRRHAVDYDQNGQRDIWGSEADIFASIANYIAAEGWKGNLTWGREVRLTKPLPADEVGMEHQRMLASWQALGVRTLAGKPLPKKELSASLIQPDGPAGRSFLVYDNFRALLRWNRSTYFAASVGLLADRLKGR